MIKKIKSFYKKNNANKVAVNTLVSYLQRFFTAFLSLITTPLILKSLGVEDFGIYTLTIGFVGTITFLNWSLSSVTQRFIAFAIGAKDEEDLKVTFSTACFLHFIYAFLILIVLWFVSNYFATDFLTIPENKYVETRNLINIVALITFISIVTIPILGLLRANENLFIISLVGVFDSVLKLTIALSLLFVKNEKLFFYGISLLIINVLIFIAYFTYSKKKYPSVVFNRKQITNQKIKELTGFISWSMMGAVAIMSRNQGVQVILNLFFGVIINAAYGIAMQISAAMSILSQGIIGAMSPQIIKSAGAKDHDKMLFLMRTMSKFSIFSISLVAIPVFFQLPFLLQLWLGEVPDQTVQFVRLIIIFGQVMLLSAGLQTVFNAIGKVKMYNIWVSSILILNLPIAYILFKLNFPSQTIIIVGIVLEFISLAVRLYLLKQFIHFSMVQFYKDALLKTFSPIIITAFVVYLISLIEISSIAILILSFITTLALLPILIFSISLEAQQKTILKSYLSKRL